MPYFVYLMRCADESIYTGITTDVTRRFAEHKAKRGGSYTRAHGAHTILYSEKHPTRSAALMRETEIKSWPQEKKLALVKTNS